VLRSSLIPSKKGVTKETIRVKVVTTYYLYYNPSLGGAWGRFFIIPKGH